MTRKIVKNNCITYTKGSNELHQEDDKPSFIQFDGYIHFFKNNKFHRQGKPCIINSNGTLEYYENDKFVKIVQR